MGWIKKAVEVGAKAVRRAPAATKEIQALGEAWGRSSKTIAKLRKGMLKENWRYNQNKRWAVNDAISDLRKYTGRVGNALAGKEMRKKLGQMKSEVPKQYQKIKDFVTSRGTGLQFNSVATGQRRKEASVLRTLRELGYQGKDPKRALKVIGDLSKRNLLPAAAAGAGVAASRKPKSQGYKYGGMVKRSRKGC